MKTHCNISLISGLPQLFQAGTKRSVRALLPLFLFLFAVATLSASTITYNPKPTTKSGPEPLRQFPDLQLHHSGLFRSVDAERRKRRNRHSLPDRLRQLERVRWRPGLDSERWGRANWDIQRNHRDGSAVQWCNERRIDDPSQRHRYQAAESGTGRAVGVGSRLGLELYSRTRRNHEALLHDGYVDVQ
jgi:hypothetical protein